MRPAKTTSAVSATVMVPIVTSVRRGLRHRLRHAILLMPSRLMGSPSPGRQVAHAEEARVDLDVEAQLLPAHARVFAAAVEWPHHHHRRQHAPADGPKVAQ